MPEDRAAMTLALSDRRPNGSSVGIVIHPAFQFGRPCVGFSRVTADTIGGMVAAGDSVDAVCDDYGLSRDDVLLACWWFAGECVGSRRKWERRIALAWNAWRCDAEKILGGHQPGQLADPPEISK